MPAQITSTQVQVRLEDEGVTLAGDLVVPSSAEGIVVFAHGSGSSRFSPRNRKVATVLQEAGLATLLFDLLTEAEEELDMSTRHLRFDIGLLTRRLIGVTEWLAGHEDIRGMAIGYFGASTGAAAALSAAARRPQRVSAIVSRGGRPDLAAGLERVKAPTLLIVGGADYQVVQLNRWALARLRCEKELRVVPRATHLFEEPGTMDEVARLAADWFTRHLRRVGSAGGLQHSFDSAGVWRTE